MKIRLRRENGNSALTCSGRGGICWRGRWKAGGGYGTDRKTKMDWIIDLRCFSLCARSFHSKMQLRLKSVRICGRFSPFYRIFVFLSAFAPSRSTFVHLRDANANSALVSPRLRQHLLARSVDGRRWIRHRPKNENGGWVKKFMGAWNRARILRSPAPVAAAFAGADGSEMLPNAERCPLRSVGDRGQWFARLGIFRGCASESLFFVLDRRRETIYNKYR